MIAGPAEPRRGEIWLAGLDPTVGHEQGGDRPCLVISDDRFNQSRAGLVIVAPITRTDRGIPSHVRIRPPEGGLTAVSFVKCEDIRSISKQRLRSKWGRISNEFVSHVEDTLRLLLRL